MVVEISVRDEEVCVFLIAWIAVLYFSFLFTVSKTCADFFAEKFELFLQIKPNNAIYV